MGLDRTAVEELERINREEIDGVRKRLHDVASVQAAHTALIETVGEQVKAMREENIRDHSEVVSEVRGMRAENEAQFEAVRRRLDLKADQARVSNHADRIDSLEGTRDRQRGVLWAGVVVNGVLLLALGVLTLLANAGGL
jgi:hypothetical protein